MRTFESLPPLKMRLLSEEMAKQRTKLSCLVFIWWPLMDESPPSVPWLRDHNRTDLSAPPDTKNLPSPENSIVKMLPVWPTQSRLWNNWDCCLDLAEQLEANEEMRRLSGSWIELPETDSFDLTLVFAADAFFFFCDTPKDSCWKTNDIRHCWGKLEKKCCKVQYRAWKSNLRKFKKKISQKWNILW